MDFWDILFIQNLFISAFVAFYLFLYFFNKLIQTKKALQDRILFLGVVFIFLFISISGIIDYWQMYYPSNLLRTISELFGFGSVISFFSICEFRIKKTRGFVTLYAIIALISYVTLKYLVSVVIENADLILTVVIAPLLIFYIAFLYLALIKPTSGYLRMRMYLVLFGFFIGLFGFFVTSSLFTGLLGDFEMSFSRIVVILGLCVMGYGLAAFSTFTDFNWKDKLRELFVISQNGVCLYAFSFEHKVALDDSDLIAGGFSGIQILLSEMMKTKESLHLIDYQNMKIMFEEGENVMFVLVFKEESSFLQYKLRLFAEEFQIFFKDILSHWTGELDVFIPTKTLIKRIFELDLK